jgi:hypothetical protein
MLELTVRVVNMFGIAQKGFMHCKSHIFVKLNQFFPLMSTCICCVTQKSCFTSILYSEIFSTRGHEALVGNEQNFYYTENFIILLFSLPRFYCI